MVDNAAGLTASVSVASGVTTPHLDTPRLRLRPLPALSLRHLVLGIAALIVAPSALALALGIAVAERNTSELFHEEASQLVDEIERKIHSHFNPAMVQAAYVADLVKRGDLDPRRDQVFGPALIAALAAAPQVRQLAFVDWNGKALRAQRSSGAIWRSDWSQDSNLRRIAAEVAGRDGPQWGNFFFAESVQRTFLTIHTPLGRNGQNFGTLVSVLSIADLSEYLERELASTGWRAVIVRDRDEVVAQSWALAAPPALSDQKPLARSWEVNDPVLTSLALAADQPDFAEGGEEFRSRSTRADGMDYFIGERQVRSFGPEAWTIQVFAPYAQIERQTDRIRLIALVGGILIGFAMLLTLMISRRLARPFRRFAVAARRVRRLDLDRVRPVRASGVVEIDAAVHDFNTMLGFLRGAMRYLPSSLVATLVRRGAIENVHTETREITVMFVDITGFTKMAEHLPAGHLVDLLNEHFAMLADCVEAEGGTVDKYIGDAMLAFWGAPEPLVDHGERAVRAALAITARLGEANRRRRRDGLAPIRVRIGLHSGPAVVGNIGAPTRLNYTVVGDTVNAAQRIEDLAKNFHRDGEDWIILASRSVVTAAGRDTDEISLGTFMLRGRGSPIEIFRIG
ncbi:MAG: adenylate/guanylate cyclase domain-containing protein [Alphaproteobacteria bacterium]